MFIYVIQTAVVVLRRLTWSSTCGCCAHRLLGGAAHTPTLPATCGDVILLLQIAELVYRGIVHYCILYVNMYLGVRTYT